MANKYDWLPSTEMEAAANLSVIFIPFTYFLYPVIKMFAIFGSGLTYDWKKI